MQNIKEKQNQEWKELHNADEIKIKKTFQQKIGSLIIGFFALMLALTMLSRAADSVTVARVVTANTKQSVLTFKLEGEGVVEAERTKAVNVQSEIGVEELFVEEGQNVKQGDLIMKLSLEDIKDALSKQQYALEKLQLERKQFGMDTTKSQISSEQEAAFALEEKKIDYEGIVSEQQYKIEQSEADITFEKEELKNAQKDYDEAFTKKSETLLETKMEELEEANQAFEDKKYTFDTEIREALRIVQDLRKSLDAIVNVDGDRLSYAVDRYHSALNGGSASDIENAQKYLDTVLYGDSGITERNAAIDAKELAIKRANEDLKAIREKWESEKQALEQNIIKAEENLEKVKNGTYDIDSELLNEKQAIKSAQAQIREKEKILADVKIDAEKNIENAQREIDKAERAVKNAQLNDEIAQENQEKEKELTALKLASKQIDINEKLGEIEKLEKLKASNGQIFSPVDGTVLSLKIEQGKKTTSDAAVILSRNSEGFLFRATVDKEMGSYLSQGDKVNITFKGKNMPVEANVESIQLLSEKQEIEVTALLPEGEYGIGASGTLEFSKNTELYRATLPLSAIREDDIGKYVLVAEKRESVLGTEQTAVRVDVSLIEKDGVNAAIDAPLSEQQEVILSSNKSISEGDRVRVETKSE